MSATIEAPVEIFEELSDLRFPPKADAHLQHLMNRHTDGLLTELEKEELEALVELSEKLSLLRARALVVLGRSPR